MEELDIGTNFDIHGEMTETPMSRTHQYRKVMKPLLEREAEETADVGLEPWT